MTADPTGRISTEISLALEHLDPVLVARAAVSGLGALARALGGRAV